MNKLCERASQSHQNHQQTQGSQCLIPSTPNLQQYKLRAKNKKNMQAMPIQPTMQPTISRSPKAYCQNHPNVIAMHNTESNPSKKYCTVCALNMQGGQAYLLGPQQQQKRKQIQKFKQKVSFLRHAISSREQQLLSHISQQQQKHSEYFLSLRTTFQSLINQIDEKHQEMNSCLIESIQKEKQNYQEMKQMVEQIKQSVERYIYDINKNYEGILKDLAMDHFEEIMDKYNAKIDYYGDKVNKNFAALHNINVYVPIHEIRKLIDKASVSYYDRFKSTPHQDWTHHRKSQSKYQGTTKYHGRKKLQQQNQKSIFRLNKQNTGQNKKLPISKNKHSYLHE